MTRRLSFPKFELTRLPAPEYTVMPADAECIGFTEKYREIFEKKLKEIQNDLPQEIFIYYNNVDSTYAQQVYAGWSELQRNLAILTLKPQAVERIYTDYQKLATSEVADIQGKQKNSQLVTIEKTDFVFDNFNNDCGYLHRKIDILNQYLPDPIRLSIWRLLTTDFLTSCSDVQRSILKDGIYDLLIDYPKQGFEIATTLLPLISKDYDGLQKVVFLTRYLNSYLCVPYAIMGMNSVRMNKGTNTQDFLMNFPETFYNEMVYILFNKPTNDWYQEAQNNAKKLLQYMIDKNEMLSRYIVDNNELDKLDYLTQLRAAINRYDANDANLDGTALSDFLNNYIDNHQQITQQKQALKEAESTITMVTPKKLDTDNDGIPQPLLNTDWQKQTRKRKFELDETIWNKEVEQTASKQIPILEALTPPIIASTKQPLPIDAFEQLLLMLKLSTEDKPIPALAEVLPAFTSESLAHLSDELWHDYVENRVSGGYFSESPEYDQRLYGIFNTKNKWFMTASSWMADETLADKVWQFMKYYESLSYVRSSILHSFKVLSALASTYPDSKRGDAALKMLIKLANKSRSTLRAHAQSSLEGYAKRLDLSMEALAERLLPDFDLGERGTKVIDYNPSIKDSRKLTISITPELKFTYQDETGKAYKTPPKARATDDEEVVTRFLDQHKLEKKELRGIATDLPKALEKMMITQRIISMSDFLDYYVKHPVAQVLVKRLVWQVQIKGIDNPIKTDKQTFRVSDSLELLDHQDTMLTDKWLAANMQVSLPHPLLLPETDIEQWSEVFADYELIQPFAQLSRPLYYLTDAEKTANKIQRFDDIYFARGSLMGLTSAAKGWEGFSHGRGDYHGFSKDINGHQISIVLYDGFPMWDKVPDVDKGHKIERIELSNNIDEISASECLLAIEELARVS